MTNKGAVRRIRSPNISDVLLGRGGGINGHSGNKVFREWVRLRKEDYNLAPNKAEKTRVATEVMNRVKEQRPPGRFLQRDPNAGPPGWWIEVDEARALAKTSQALREGAPQIRAAHQQVGGTRKRKASNMGTTTTTSATITTATTTTIPSNQEWVLSPSNESVTWPQTVPPVTTPAQVGTGSQSPPPGDTTMALSELGRNWKEARSTADRASPSSSPPSSSSLPAITRPLMSNREFQQTYSKPQEKEPPMSLKRARMDVTHVHENAPIDFYGDTPPLTSAPAKDRTEIPNLNWNPPPSRPSFEMKRSNSLAFSDFSEPIDIDYEFVNPFTDENEFFWPETDGPQSPVPPPPVVVERPVRNVSGDQGREDYKSMAELYYFPTQSPSIGDFNEEVKSILDVVQRDGDLTAPDGVNQKYSDYSMPTLLIPWRGGVLKRRYSSSGISTASSGHRVLAEVRSQ